VGSAVEGEIEGTFVGGCVVILTSQQSLLEARKAHCGVSIILIALIFVPSSRCANVKV